MTLGDESGSDRRETLVGRKDFLPVAQPDTRNAFRSRTHRRPRIRMRGLNIGVSLTPREITPSALQIGVPGLLILPSELGDYAIRGFFRVFFVARRSMA